MGHASITLKRLFSYIRFFLRFCVEQKIDFVFAHLSIPSLISVLGQYFLKAKVVCFRHHYNFVLDSYKDQYPVNKVEKLIDRINASLATKIIIPSEYLKRLIYDTEGTPLKKMVVIPYVYNWKRFLERVDYIPARSNKKALNLLIISRLTKLKRPEVAIELVAALHKKNVDAELMIVGTGMMEAELKGYALSLDIAPFVQFAGFQKNVVPFICNADVIIHPSLTEASSSVIKEAGVLGCPAIVCNGVGDFGDYIQNGENGWIVNADDFCVEAERILIATNREKRMHMGRSIKQTILKRFSISDSVVSSYEALLIGFK
jgi:glycosyltransferase involved in cell wall biosynthesis